MCDIVVISCFVFFFFKQKTAYEMRISDWSSDVCSSDLFQAAEAVRQIESAPSCRPAPFALGNARQMRQQVQAITETPNLACFVAQQRQIGRASCRERVCQYV